MDLLFLCAQIDISFLLESGFFFFLTGEEVSPPKKLSRKLDYISKLTVSIEVFKISFYVRYNDYSPSLNNVVDPIAIIQTNKRKVVYTNAIPPRMVKAMSTPFSNLVEATTFK